MFKEGETICIQEILDGKDVHIEINRNGDVEIWPEDFAEVVRGDFTDLGEKIIHGTWMKEENIIRYHQSVHWRWFVHDIFDRATNRYLTQKEVYNYCIRHNILCTNVKYLGKFISMDHCLRYLNKPAYGNRLKGIVIKQDGAGADRESVVQESAYYKAVEEEKVIDITRGRISDD